MINSEYFFLTPNYCLLALCTSFLFVISQSVIVYTLEIKSLLPSPAYRRAGFTKGREGEIFATCF